MPRFSSPSDMRYTSGAGAGGGGDVAKRQVETVVMRSCCAVYDSSAFAPGWVFSSGATNGAPFIAAKQKSIAVILASFLKHLPPLCTRSW